MCRQAEKKSDIVKKREKVENRKKRTIEQVGKRAKTLIKSARKMKKEENS